MDIEEYLRQKRELEAKKEMLEAKEKVDQDKDRFKKDHRAKLYAEHGVTPKHTSADQHPSDHNLSHSYRAPSSGPGVWNTLLLFLIFVLLVVSYFMPRFGEDQIRGIVQQETDNDPAKTSQTQEDTKEKEDIIQNVQDEEEDDIKDPPDGPLITIFTKDDEEGQFDDEGKIDGEILVLNIASGLKYYEDFTIQINNKEIDPIMCKIDREVQIDTNFDGKNDLEDHDLDRFKIEFDPKSTETINTDVVPGTIDNGNYEGKGDISTTYEARCYFCLDEDCKKTDDAAESTSSTFFRVLINKELEIGTTNNNTNRSR